MKIYEIPRGSRIFGSWSDGSAYVTFYHLDGMHGYCQTEKGQAVYIAASQDLVVVAGDYEIVRLEVLL